MARLQILELPTEHHGDDMTTPFVLVIDQARAEDFYPDTDGKTTWQIFQERATAEDPAQRIADQIGARAVLVFEDTVNIPANGTDLGTDEAFKTAVQDWAAGTNETLWRIIEAKSHKRRPRRDAPPAPSSPDCDTDA
ncbi:hypothetical protein [Streptomyces luteocolor]|uniref:hypothetical protein n=1 Tax=Streptomyces luteocolor TaxID=285500 RepID=UPI0008534842|nr:hypothetical protein [Streptomyces luteocolor]